MEPAEATRVALIDSSFSPGERAPLTRRMYWFTARTLLALVMAYTAVSLVGYEARLIRDGRVLDHPLWTALDSVGASVQGTEIVVWAPVGAGPRPPMAELKALAAGVARRHGGTSEVKMWSEAESSYHVVYFQGKEEAGGTWTASARYLPDFEGAGAGGRVEMVLQRSLSGRYEDLRGAVHRMQSHLERAVNRPLPGASFRVRVQARPTRSGDPKRLAEAVLRETGADVRYVSTSAERVEAVGYSPRLAGRVVDGNQTVNVAVRISPHGRGPWIEIGVPTL